MFLQIFFHLAFIFVFLFGNTFLCTASTTSVSGPEHYSHKGKKNTSHDCCPKDGHKKQIEGKDIVQTLQKQGVDIDLFIPRNEKAFFDKKTRTDYQISYYQGPQYDRQSLFFTDTIKLLL